MTRRHGLVNDIRETGEETRSGTQVSLMSAKVSASPKLAQVDQEIEKMAQGGAISLSQEEAELWSGKG